MTGRTTGRNPGEVDTSPRTQEYDSMRKMMKAAAPTLAALLLISGSARADDPKTPVGPGFKGIADLEGVVQIAKGFSPDQQAVTVIFRNLEAATSGKNGPVVDSRTVTVALPIAKNVADLAVTQDIRGFVSIQGKARVALVVQSAGKTTIVDLDKARNAAKSKSSAQDGSESKARARAVADEQAKSLPASATKEGSFDFSTRIDGTVAAGSSYAATFFLLVERADSSDDSGALLVVDTFDVEIHASKKK